MHSKSTRFKDTLINIVASKQFSKQREIVEEMKRRGFKTASQPKVSRVMKMIGAVRVVNALGEISYTISNELSSNNKPDLTASLVVSIESNSSLVIIKTHPGAAPFIGKLLDSLPNSKKSNILGVLSGDDTVFVAPVQTSTLAIQELTKYIYKALLPNIDY